jgi:hypothetical protein
MPDYPYHHQELVAHLVEVRDEITRSDERSQNRNRVGGNLIPDGFDAVIAQLDGGLDSLAVTAGRGFELVTSQLAELAASLEKIKLLTEFPRKAEAAERLNNGVYALGRRLMDDAVTELRAAVDLNRFNPSAHFLLGDAYHALGDHVSAAQAYASAVKYGVEERLDLTITAARRAAEAYGKVKAGTEDDRQQAVLNAALEAVPGAAEVALDLARFKPELLVLALRLAPDLLLFEPGIRGLPNLEQAAKTVLSDEDGLARRYELAREIGRRATGIPSDAPLQECAYLRPLPEQVGASDRLTALAAVLPEARKYLRRLAEDARALAARRTDDALSRIAQHEKPAPPLPGAPQRPPQPEPGLKARLFPVPGAAEVYRDAMSAYDAATEQYELRRRHRIRAEEERQDALTAAKRNAELEQLNRHALETLAEDAERAAAELTPRYTKGVRIPRAARPGPELGRPGANPV